MSRASEELDLWRWRKTEGEYYKNRFPFTWKGEALPCNFEDVVLIIGAGGCDVDYEDDADGIAISGEIKYDGPIDLKAEILKMQADEPMKVLRLQRTLKLEDTDWMAMGDRTPTKAQKDYRQALRDLPSTATPTFDEKGWLDDDSFDWPTEP